MKNKDKNVKGHKDTTRQEKTEKHKERGLNREMKRNRKNGNHELCAL